MSLSLVPLCSLGCLCGAYLQGSTPSITVCLLPGCVHAVTPFPVLPLTSVAPVRAPYSLGTWAVVAELWPPIDCFYPPTQSSCHCDGIALQVSALTLLTLKSQLPTEKQQTTPSQGSG